jgi:hypothetical protein
VTDLSGETAVWEGKGKGCAAPQGPPDHLLSSPPLTRCLTRGEQADLTSQIIERKFYFAKADKARQTPTKAVKSATSFWSEVPEGLTK